MRFRKRDAESRLDAELRYHFDRMVREAVDAGVAPDEARRRASTNWASVWLWARAAARL